MNARYVRPEPPVSVTDWYAKGMAVLERFTRRVNTMNSPVVYDDLNEAVRLCQELVKLVDPDVVRDVKAVSPGGPAQ